MTYDQLPKRYRMVDAYNPQNDGPTMETYYVVRKTPAGAWVAPRWAVSGFDASTGQPVQWDKLSRRELQMEGARFVLDGNGKRFAHESEEWARDSYRIRKQRQIQHARNLIAAAENCLSWLDNGKPVQGEMVPFFTPFDHIGPNGYA